MAAVGTAALVVGSAAPGAVTTLREGLAKTYEANPTIMAERAQLRSLDEDVAIARSFGRPQLSVNADVNNDLLLLNIPGAGGRSLNARADLSLPLYAGGHKKVTALVARDRRWLRLELNLPAAVTTWRLVLRDAARAQPWLAPHA